MMRFIVAAVVVYLAFAGYAFFMSDRLIFQPPPASYTTAERDLVMIPGADGTRLAALHLKNPSARFTVLFTHGNAEDIGHSRPLLEELRAAGFSVVAYDYRGYGLSTGARPSVAGALRDADAVYRFVVDSLHVDPTTLIVHGRSVGTGPATHIASHHAVGGLILESGFVSAFRVLTRWPLLPFDRFRNLAELSRVTAPVLVMHGTEDEVIAFWHGQRLFDAARGPKAHLWVKGAGHNDLRDVAGSAYLDAVKRFVDGIGRR